jgi:phosphoadenosine phosphosulfate reductase
MPNNAMRPKRKHISQSPKPNGRGAKGNDMLKENQLFGVHDLVKIAIDRLQFFEAQALAMQPFGYWLAFSGGKDSIVIKDLAIKAGVKFEAHFNITTVDPPELMQYIREHHADVKRDKPRISMWKLIEKKMMPPTRIVRYCCEELKERGGNDCFVVTGIRWQESGRRAKRRMTESCFRGGKKRYLHPIIDWSDKDVWQYIRENELPYCRLYDEGFSRIGCVGCPMAGDGRLKEFARWPRFEKAYKRSFSNAFKILVNSGVGAKRNLKWKSGEEMFDWWINKNRETEDPDQGVLFE